MRSMPKLVLGGVAAVAAGAAYWWRRNPSACPYGQRFFIEAPHPFITRSRLLEILAPQPGERILEVGPGTGYYSLDVAKALEPNGRLDIFDIQEKMLEHTLGRARLRGIDGITATQGDAASLTYPDRAFDAAYLVATLGEIPDKRRALRELERVLKPNGRLVVGEILMDPHTVTLDRLRSEAASAGLRYENRIGGRLGYFARFVVR